MIVCAAFAFVPVLNASFSAFNENYYSRWYFMPLLIMACMTVQILEKKRYRDLRAGVRICAAAAAAITVFAAFPVLEDGERKWFGISDNPDLLKTEILATALQLAILILLVYAIPLMRIKRSVRRGICAAAITACCMITTVSVLYNGNSLIAKTGGVKWRTQLLETRPALGDTDTFSRVETESTSTNYEMVWGYPTIHCFESTVHPSIFSFYREIGMIRTVESTLPVERVGARALVSARYYIENTLVKPRETIEEKGGLYGYEQVDENNGYRIFESRNYIPMGFTFESYMTQENYDAIGSRETSDRLLVKNLILTKEQKERYGHMMEEDTETLKKPMSDDQFDLACRERAASACRSFQFTNRGFEAQADLPADNLVFFSVPYDEGFTAYVDGRETVTERVDGGLMAVPVPAGEHRIEVVYRQVGLRAAVFVSLITAFLLIIYVFGKRFVRRNTKVRGTSTNVLAIENDP